MAVMDEFKEERKQLLKHGTLKQKITYFWEYYKWHAIIPLVIIITLSGYIYSIVTKPDIRLSGALLNAHNIEAQTLSTTLADGFCKQYKIDTKEYEVTLNTSLSLDGDNIAGAGNYETLQTLLAWVGAGTVDFISGDLKAMTELAYRGYVTDLRQILDKEELAKYEPYFLYIDQSVMDKKLDTKDLIAASAIKYPDCTKPEAMENPIPVFIDVSQCKKLTDICINSEFLVLGITPRTENKEMTINFLEYVMK